MKTILIVITSFILGLSNYSSESTENFYQNCQAELKVEKNRSFKSADEEGASFVLTLKNTSSSSEVYTIETKNLESSCYDTKKWAGANISLQTNTLLSNNSGQASTKVTLKSGESLSFIVEVTVPEGTSYEKWGCIEVSATPKKCASPVKQILSVYVPNPSKG